MKSRCSNCGLFMASEGTHGCVKKQRRPWTELFWPKVDRRGPDECWPWLGRTDKDGYGQFGSRSLGPSTHRAHVLAWETANGPIPKGRQGCHTCDNPPCCNPRHIYPGTALDNVRDKQSRGRSRGPRGERNQGARLTWEQVAEIRERYARNPIQRPLAHEYGVSPSTIWRVVHDVHWMKK